MVSFKKKKDIKIKLKEKNKKNVLKACHYNISSNAIRF